MARITKAGAMAHYAADVKGATERQLYMMLREDYPKPQPPKVVREALHDLALEELIARGVPLPEFTALWITV